MTQPLEPEKFDEPDEVREGDNQRLELETLADGARAGRVTLQSSWQWSQAVKPGGRDDSVQAPIAGERGDSLSVTSAAGG